MVAGRSPSTAPRSGSTGGSSPRSSGCSTPNENDRRTRRRTPAMPKALVLVLALLGQDKADPDQFPIALHRSMEIDDLDREVQRLHDTVLLKRGQFASSQRLASRGLVSRSDLERDAAALRYEE